VLERFEQFPLGKYNFSQLCRHSCTPPHFIPAPSWFKAPNDGKSAPNRTPSHRNMIELRKS